MKNFTLALGFVICFFMVSLPVVMLLCLNNNQDITKIQADILLGVAIVISIFGIMLIKEITKSGK